MRPSIGLIYGVGDDDIDMPPPVLRRELLVGWRTWFGPEYVEKYGRDLLLGLPDRAEPLDLVTGKRGVYAGVGAYLTEHDIRPAWPRLPRPKSGATPRRGWAAQPVSDSSGPPARSQR
ncbi:MAG: hypothetical protein IT306_06690 [Chloroflexi bacterium]|nr:hypothetical protein [Chloroflexota bacterium]